MWDKILKTLLILALILCGSLFIAGSIDYAKTCYELKYANWRLQQRLRHCEEALIECREYNIFQSSVEEIGQRKYSEEYDCLDHARDLYKELEKANIKSSIFINEDRSHAWLGVWVETTEGGFVDLNGTLKIIEVRDGDLNTICSCE